MRDLARIAAKLAFEPSGWFILPWKYEALVKLLAQYQLSKAETEVKAESETETGRRVEDQYYQVVEGVAVVPLVGIIGKRLGLFEMMCGGACVDRFATALMYAEADDTVSAVMLDISSPGGTGGGLPEIVTLINRIKATKPVIAYTDTDMCSAAYWIGCAASEVWAAPSACVGSISAYITLVDSSRAYEEAGLERIVLRTGDLKGIGIEGKVVEGSERAFLQASLDKHSAWFKETVKANRPGVSDDTMRGQWFDGRESLSLGLVDELVDSRSEALGLLIQMKSLSKILETHELTS